MAQEVRYGQAKGRMRESVSKGAPFVKTKKHKSRTKGKPAGTATTRDQANALRGIDEDSE